MMLRLRGERGSPLNDFRALRGLPGFIPALTKSNQIILMVKAPGGRQTSSGGQSLSLLAAKRIPLELFSGMTLFLQYVKYFLRPLIMRGKDNETDIEKKIL